MICDSVLIKGDVEIGDQTVIHPQTVIIAEKGSPINIGEGNVIEERVRLTNTSIAMASLIETGSSLSNSYIGSYCRIGSKCQIINCVIGNCCVVSPMVRLEGVTIPEGTSVYPCGSGWKMIPVQINTAVSVSSYLLFHSSSSSSFMI